MALPSGSRFGPYEILAAIGAGGMGEVYRARDTRLNRDVAIKVIAAGLADSPDALARFEREARAVAALAHPNILALHDVGIVDGTPYTVTELLAGESLRDALRTGALPLRRALDYAVQIASGLAAAHDKGIVHRDLKPENAFVTTTGIVKILDFGLAKHTPQSVDDDVTQVHERHTATAMILGTPGYMAPEQARAEPVDHRVDIFSFGAIVYEMLTSRRAFQHDTPAETMLSVLRDDPPRIGSDVPSAVAAIVSRCLEKRREDRFQSADDLAFALKELSQSGASVETPPTAPLIIRAAWASAAVLLLITVTLAALVYKQRTEPAAKSDAAEIRLELTTPSDSQFNVVSLSPDGASLVYQAGGQLWLRSLSAVAPRPLTAGARMYSGLPTVNRLASSMTRSSIGSISRVGSCRRWPERLKPTAPRGMVTAPSCSCLASPTPYEGLAPMVDRAARSLASGQGTLVIDSRNSCRTADIFCTWSQERPTSGGRMSRPSIRQTAAG